MRAARASYSSLFSPLLRVPHLGMRTYQIWQESGIQGLRQQIKYRNRYQRAEKVYREWVAAYDTLTAADREAIEARINEFRHRPLISVVMPVYNVEEIWLRRAIDSVRTQLYERWELCIADDNSIKPHVRVVLEEYAAQDSRIKIVFRKENGHISAASNSALELATGEFVALFDNDDELSEHALYVVAEEINAYPEVDLIYSDNDFIDEHGTRYQPNFKTDWNPDLFYSLNLISHLGVYRRSIVEKIGGFREGYEGSQDYDLALRVIEQIPEKHIRHVPYILYHWRAIHGSVALNSNQKEYAHEAARKAIGAHFARTKIDAVVTQGHESFHRVVYTLPESLPLVSLIITTRDHVDLLRQIISGVLEKTDYQRVELLIVDNQSNEPATLKYLSEIENDPRVKVLRYDAPFNYSAMNNLAAQHSTGEIIGLVNNDIKVISPDWLKEMVCHAQRPEIGAVGAKLYYADDSIQHAGIITGIQGVAVNIYRRVPKRIARHVTFINVIQNFSAVTAACMIMRKQVFDEAGGFDAANLPVVYNEVDFCLRIRERGYRILWTPYAELYHLESASQEPDSTSQRLTRFRKETDYMKSRWGRLLSSDPYYNLNLTLDGEPFELALPMRISKPWKN